MDVQHKNPVKTKVFAKIELRVAEYADFELHPRKDLLGFYFWLRSSVNGKIDGPYKVNSYTNMREFEYWYRNNMMYVCCSALDGDVIIEKEETQVKN